MQFLVLTVAGWVNRHQDDLIDYLREENRVLREQLGSRPPRLTDAQRRRLAVRGHKLGRRVLTQVAGIVTPDTILRWYRKLIAKKYDGSACRGRGRPGTRREVAGLVVRMAVDNPQWGYTRIRGALSNLGHHIARTTVKRILHDHGIACSVPPPVRHQPHSTLPAMFALGLKILVPSLVYASDIYNEWGKQHDKSVWRLAKRKAVGAIVTMLVVAGLVYDHENQATAVATAQEENTELRREVAATRDEATAARNAATETQRQLRDLKRSIDTVVALYPGVTDQEALGLIVEELRGLRERSADLEDQLTGLMTYSDVAELNILGETGKAGIGIGESSALIQALDGAWKNRGGRHFARCDQDSRAKFLAAIEIHPTFPFTYYALSVCSYDAGDDTWRQYAERAVGILEHTTRIAGHHQNHDEVYEYLRSRLEQQQ